MAYSTQRAVSDGNLQMLRLSIVYLDRKDIQVLLAGVLSTAWKWVDDTTIRFDAVVPNGVEVRIKRTTDVSQSRHIFSKGAAFIEETLDEDFTQVLFIAQEAIEGANLAEMFQDLDMHGYKLKNLGTATERNQAVSYGQFLDEAASPAVSAATAKASSDAAAMSAQNAEVARVSSAASAATAVAAADSADISERNAKASELSAGISAANAKASEIASAASAASAAASAGAVNPDAYIAKVGGNTGALQAPAGTDAQRPTGVLGMLRYNIPGNYLEVFNPGGWANPVPSDFATVKTDSISKRDGSRSISTDSIMSGVAKAYGSVSAEGAVETGSGFNIASVTKHGGGIYTITFSKPAPIPLYAVLFGGVVQTTTNLQNRTQASCQVAIRNMAGQPTDLLFTFAAYW